MNIAEAIVVKHTSGQRQKCIDDVKFKLLGGDKFESKNDYKHSGNFRSDVRYP